MKTPKIIYIFDALCGWCYGFNPVIKAIHETYKDQFDFEVISAGMYIGESVAPVSNQSPFIKVSYKTIEQTTGIHFGENYLRNLDEEAILWDSGKPAVALSVFKSYQPDRAIFFAGNLLDEINFEGKDPNDDLVYRYLAVNYSIDPDEFMSEMQSEEYKQAAYYDFALAKQLNITAYPAVLLQHTDHHFYLVTRGFADLDTVELRMKNVLKEINGEI